MPSTQHDKGSIASAMRGSVRRRKGVVIGIAGLVTVLGVGTFAIDRSIDGGLAVPAEPGQHESARSNTVPASVAPTAPAGESAATSGRPAPVVSPTTKSPLERAAKARAANAKASTQVRSPLPPNGRTVDTDVTVHETGDVRRDGKTLRVVSARQDLTGLRELAWVADDGQPVGMARCTQKIRLSNNPAPRIRPTLLLCWRTSEKKSVYTVAVDLHSRPSAQESVRAIEKAWAEMP